MSEKEREMEMGQRGTGEREREEVGDEGKERKIEREI